jgi:dihydrodipicolinate synthase/N-acetylneuraminate lyase
VLAALRQGLVIPAHPLALNSKRQLDEKRQRALTRYYCEAGSGGIAVGVHTTQFEIRDPKFALYEPVLTLTAETIDHLAATAGRTIIKIAGIAGLTSQAVKESQVAADLGYHLGMVSLGALRTASNSELIAHLRAIAVVIPVMGFYLQPAVGGRVLDYAFWRQAVEIENLVAIKVAAFNRYFTLEVIRAVAEAGRAGEIALYTGNDDHIVMDLLSEFRFTEKENATPCASPADCSTLGRGRRKPWSFLPKFIKSTNNIKPYLRRCF